MCRRSSDAIVGELTPSLTYIGASARATAYKRSHAGMPVESAAASI